MQCVRSFACVGATLFAAVVFAGSVELTGVETESRYGEIVYGATYDVSPDAEVVSAKLVYGEDADELTQEVEATVDDGVVRATVTGLADNASVFAQFVLTYKSEDGTATIQSEVMEARTRILLHAVPGGTKNYTAAGSWDLGFVPNGYSVDVVIDGDPNQNTTIKVEVPSSTSTSTIALSGSLTIDEGDAVTFNIGSKTQSANAGWEATTITNFGQIALGTYGANNQKIYFKAYEFPFFNGATGEMVVHNSNRDSTSHSMTLKTEGSRNEGQMTVSHARAKKRSATLSLKGGGTFINNGTIKLLESGDYTNSDNGSVELSFADATSVMSGTGRVLLESAGNGTVNLYLRGSGINTNLINDVQHSIVGVGTISNCRLINRGLLRSVGDRSSLRIKIGSYRSVQTAMTNEVSGRIVADSGKGIYFAVDVLTSDKKLEEHNGWNCHFINKGHLEARTGSVIEFANGINTKSTSTSSADLNNFETQYLELWGTVAGGGLIKSVRTIYIGDGATLSPGDYSNDDGTGISTCGTLSFFSNLVMRAESTSVFQFAGEDGFDAVHAGGSVKVDGTLKVVGRVKSGTYRMITADAPITSENANWFAAFDMREAMGTSRAPRFTVGSETVEVAVDDAESGEPTTVEKTIYYLDATVTGSGLSINIR